MNVTFYVDVPCLKLKAQRSIIYGDATTAEQIEADCKRWVIQQWGELRRKERELEIESHTQAQIKQKEANYMIKLGKKARDKITGIEGIIVGKTTYLFGCDCYGIAPPAKDGACLETCWFDEGRIEIIGEGVSPESVRVEANGGLGISGPNNRIR